MSAKPQTAPLFEMIQKATAADLAQLDEKIEAMQATARQHQGEIDRLASLRKTINILVNGKPERKKNEKKAPKATPGGGNSDSLSDRRIKIAKLLSKHGATKPAQLASDLATSQANVMYALNCGYFIMTPNGYLLTPEGRSQLLED